MNGKPDREPMISDANPCQGDDQPKELAVTAAASHPKWLKPLLIVAAIGLATLLYFQYGHLLSLESLAARESALRAFQANNPYLVYGIALLVYVTVTGLSIPGASPLTLVYGWYFGFWQAVLLVSFASTAGATLAFLMSRYLLRESVQTRFGDRLQAFNDRLEKEGAFYLFTLRLIPAVPFFVINLVMGLTPMKAVTFWWVSQIGMLPGTMVYVYAGSRVPNLTVLASEKAGAVFSPAQLLQLAIAFGLLGIFPLLTKKVFERVAAARDPAGETQSGR
jgi:uncharacterized membrane protein YdjX (TVP38/TMEM64 family)